MMMLQKSWSRGRETSLDSDSVRDGGSGALDAGSGSMAGAEADSSALSAAIWCAAACASRAARLAARTESSTGATRLLERQAYVCGTRC